MGNSIYGLNKRSQSFHFFLVILLSRNELCEKKLKMCVLAKRKNDQFIDKVLYITGTSIQVSIIAK